jgi:hypothetical protein
VGDFQEFHAVLENLDFAAFMFWTSRTSAGHAAVKLYGTPD